jgi:hypothetical protein
MIDRQAGRQAGPQKTDRRLDLDVVIELALHIAVAAGLGGITQRLLHTLHNLQAGHFWEFCAIYMLGLATSNRGTRYMHYVVMCAGQGIMMSLCAAGDLHRGPICHGHGNLPGFRDLLVAHT